MIPSENSTEISMKRGTCVLLGVKGLRTHFDISFLAKGAGAAFPGCEYWSQVRKIARLLCTFLCTLSSVSSLIIFPWCNLTTYSWYIFPNTLIFLFIYLGLLRLHKIEGSYLRVVTQKFGVLRRIHIFLFQCVDLCLILDAIDISCLAKFLHENNLISANYC